MNYSKNRAPQSVRLLVERAFPSFEVSPEVTVNSIVGQWNATRGYFVRFKLLVSGPFGALNLCGCVLEAEIGGVLKWKTARFGSGARAVELDPKLYQTVLEAFRAQSWILNIGSSKLGGNTLHLPPDDPLQKALDAARRTV